MTFWAKLLTIIVFVLSIAFASMSAVIFAKRQPYREELAKTVQELEDTKKAKGNEIENLKATVAAMDTVIKEKVTTIQTGTLQLDAAKGDLQKEKADRQKLETDLYTEKTNLALLANANQTLTNKYDSTSKENEKLDAQIRDYIVKLTTEQTRANVLQNQKTDLENRLASLKESYAKAQAEIERNTNILAELSRRDIEARTVMGQLIPLPMVKGKVAQVNEATKTVVLNVGKNQNVRKNYTFRIFRGDTFVGQALVFDLGDDMCGARIIQKEQAMKVGDDAWTRYQ